MFVALLLAGVESVGFLHSVKGEVRLDDKPVFGLVRVAPKSRVAVAKGGAVIYVARKTGNRWQIKGPFIGQGVAEGLRTISGRPTSLRPLTAMARSTDRGFGTTAGPILRFNGNSRFTHFWPVGNVRPADCRITWDGDFRSDAFRIRVFGRSESPLWESTQSGDVREVMVPAKFLASGTTIRITVTALNGGKIDGVAEQVVGVLDAASLKLIQTMDLKQGASVAWAECLESCGLFSEAAAAYDAVGEVENATRLRSMGDIRK